VNAPLLPVADDARIAALEARIAQLETINAALIDRVERASDFTGDMQGGAFSMFETAISLEALVRERTAAAQDALHRLSRANAELVDAHRGAEEARTRLRDAIESLSDGFALFDGEDRLILCNAAYRGFWPEVAHHEHQAPAFAEVARLVAESGRVIGSLVSPERWIADRLAHHNEARGVHTQALSDGRWIQINELPTSEGGRVAIYTDITEVKAEDARQRARELAEKSAILQATLDTIRLGVAVYDAERRLAAWNGQLLATIGLPDSARSKVMTHAGMVETCRQVNGPFGADRPLDWLGPGSGEVVALRRQSSGRVIEVRRAPMPDGGMVMTFEEVTERLQAAEALERRVAERTMELRAEVAERRAVEAQLLAAKTAAEHANRSKTRFLAAASHDLLQPLNAARLFVAALSERRLALQTRALVRQTGVALDSVEELLEVLFEISRLDAGAVQPDIGAIELDRMLGALRIEFAAQAKQAGLTLEIPDTGLWVRSDFRMLRRILQNFLSNALRYTMQGAVRVMVDCDGAEARIAVHDTGRGIDPANFEVIFEEFRRLAPDRGPAGKGLGLAIVRRAANMLGHRLDIASRPREGSEFAVIVPLTAPEEVADTHQRRRQRAENDATDSMVLILDNEPAILTGMEALLGKWGYRVMTAPTLEAAMAVVAEKGAPALIIADFHLDDGALGDAAVARLRTQLRREVPAMIISADRSEEVKAQLSTAGLAMLHKPIKPAQLRALMRTLMS